MTDLEAAWLEHYRAGGPSPVAIRRAALVAEGYPPAAVDRAREWALEVHLYGGRLPGCSFGVPRAFRNLVRRRPGCPPSRRT